MNWFSMRRRMMGKGLSVGSLAVGREVIIPVDGVNYNWIVVHQGVNPCTSKYSGTWLMMKNIYLNAVYLDGTHDGSGTSISGHYSYQDPAISDYLNGDFYEMLDDKVKPYLRACTYDSDAESDKGLVFRCAARNLGFEWNTYATEPDTPGNAFDYFKECDPEKLVAEYNGEAQPWWTNGRIAADGVVMYVTTDGKIDSYSGNKGTAGIRPMLLCDPDFKILRDMIV